MDFLFYFLLIHALPIAFFCINILILTKKKTMLHNLSLLTQVPDFIHFWIKFLNATEGFLRSSDELLSLQFSESLKNLLLVLVRFIALSFLLLLLLLN